MSDTRHAPPRLALVAAVTSMLGLGATASGQHALGQGDALDNNLRVGSGGRNFGAYVPDFVARNLVVTNSVPGGRGFRGSVGYNAIGDFGGSLGSDDLYGFRADSAMSSGGFWQHGPSATQARFGAALGDLTYRREFTTRAPAMPSAPANALDRTIQLDRVVTSVSQADMVTTTMMPQLVGVMATDSERFLANASSLQGVTFTTEDETGGLVGLTLFDMLNVRDERARVGQPIEGDAVETDAEDAVLPPTFVPGTDFKLDFQPYAASAAIIEQLPVDQRFQARRIQGLSDVSADYAQILEGLLKRYGDAQDVEISIDGSLLEGLDESYDALRQRLLGAPAVSDADETGSTGWSIDPVPGMGTGTDTDTGTGTDGDAEEAAEGDETIFGIESRGRAKSLDEFGVLLQHGETITTFAGDNKSRFNELLEQGQAELSSGEYFRAERRFQRALRFTPGHPLAQIGMGHAQLGAGLYRVAAATIELTLRNHPELIDTRYAPSLLPNNVRLMDIVDDLRGGTGTADEAATALLKAYIGHQTRNTALTDEGLAELNADDALTTLLRRIWGDAPTK